ncbi:MAG: methionyl-tRNA formyltransferase [Kiritimatiellia bacterium]
MRIVFMGSAEIACETLTMLMQWPAVKVVGVISQPDRPGGRKLQLASCPAKRHAEALGVEIYTPERVNSDESIARIRSWEPEVGIVMAYGQILRPALLEIPQYGFLNVHTSLLPRYRGAAPIQCAITNGDLATGVTVMQMDAGMDTGDILAMLPVPIGESDTAGDLHAKLAVGGARLLRTVLADLVAGRARRRPQPSEGVSYAPRLEKSAGRIDWTQPARRIYNQIRGFNPWPCCFCEYETGGRWQTLRVLRAECRHGSYGKPGEILADKSALVVACGEGALQFVEVQPQGGKVISGEAFVRGRRLEPGMMLGKGKR